MRFGLHQVLLSLSLAAACCAQDSPAKPPDRPAPPGALQVIEGVRGGRHWVDEKTAPPKSPDESLACIQIEPGLEIQLVAAEPLVRDPVAIAFDHRGRMFVVEYGDYPTGPEKQGADPLSRIVYLEDVDGDGRADKRHLFADKLNFAHSLMPWRGGLLVGAQTEVLFLQDQDGDHRADVREVLLRGFTPAHPQMQIGNPRWGIDNWVYLNYGPGTIVSSQDPDHPLQMPRKDIRFDPRTMELAADSGMGQFGNTIDRWGNRFYCTNRNPIMTTLLTPETLTRNPFAVIPTGHYDVGRSGGDTRVYPLVEMKSNYLSHAGTHTSACGVTAYTGDLLGAAYDDSVFVCEPIGHLVTRSIVRPQGPRLTAERARPKADFIASTDTWFRPASLANGPDGAIYLADMYRLWVEHPKFLPPEIAKRLDWRAGDDRGRIYRIAPAGARPRPFHPPSTTADLLGLLSDPNAWRQFLGQRLLVERQETGAAPRLRELLRSDKLATTRLHAMWTLDGLEQLETADLQAALSDPDPHVRKDAVKLAAQRLADGTLFSGVADAVSDADARVRLQACVALGEADRPEVTELLATIARRDGQDPWFVSALLSSSGQRAGAVLQLLLSDPRFAAQGDAANVDLVKRLATAVAARGKVEELRGVLAAPLTAEDEGAWWQAAAISGLGRGLPRHRGDLGRISLPSLLGDPPPQLAASAAKLRALLERNQQAALDPARPEAERAASVELLAWQPFEQAAGTLETLMSSGQPVSVQAAAIESLANNGSPEAAKIVLRKWPQLGPAVRGDALNLLLRRTESTRLALEAMAAGKMRPAALSIDQRVRLLKHSDKALRDLAAQLFGGAVSSNRQQVAEQYQAALSMDASSARGVKVFQRICAKCHRIDGQGHEAGPDLSDVRNRSRLALLYDILDPNSKVEPRFTSYSVRTVDGVVVNGLILSETPEAVVLQLPEGKRQTIGRGEIEALRASSVSLMPEGIEKDVSVQEMADLLEYLKSRGAGS